MSRPLTVKLGPAELLLLETIVREHEPFVRRHAVHLAALRLGLAELKANPDRLADALRADVESPLR
jgi:hypothetical protein